MEIDVNNIYALLIGVGDYKKMNIKDLPSYKMDLALIGSSLIAGLKCEKDHIRFMAGEDNNGIVNMSSLAIAIKALRETLSDDDTFIFYFSGHGSFENLIFSDGGVDQQSVINFIDMMPCKNKIVILDCCHSGNFNTYNGNHIGIEQSVDEFVGHGIAVYASSAENEVSRLGPDGKHSMFTGALAAAMISPVIVHKGMIELGRLYEETQYLVKAWNKKYPDKAQNPIFRSNIGGTLFFKVSDYKPYEPGNYTLENEKYKIVNVKSISNVSEKRLCAFVILKNKSTVKELYPITKEIAGAIKYADIYSGKRDKLRFANKPAKAVWCYFGNDESDIINGNHEFYTIYASEDVRGKYYCENKNMTILKDICIFSNTSYELVKNIQKRTVTKEEYIKQCRNFLKLFIDRAQDFCTDLQEVENQKLTFMQLQVKYKQWVENVKHEYIRLSDMEIPPDDIHDWAEEILSLSGWVVDISIYLNDCEKEGGVSESKRWLIKKAVRNYYDSLERLRVLEEGMY